MGSTDGGGLILDAMLNVANATKFPEFAGESINILPFLLKKWRQILRCGLLCRCWGS